jgi:succinate dehydrogenase / fumarate reductase flavoprotein subunit
VTTDPVTSPWFGLTRPVLEPARERLQTHEHDVVVIGAGGAGLRAAIEAAAQGARTALVCKSLLGKAHTVMAEGGIAAALGNVWPEDNWKVHFRDTMRGGKLLNNWRMAQIHAQEAPDRVLELEEWGAVFDRTKDGLILQRDFGGHRYARLAHVGDRTGLEMIRTLQYRAIYEPNIDIFMECTIIRLLTSEGRIAGAFGYWRETGAPILFRAKAVILATGGVGKAWRVTSNSWEYTGDGMAMALEAGADLIDMEMVQFHPTGMIWPPSVRGILVTEGVRGDGGTLKNSEGRRFMFDYIPEFFRADTADTEEEADRWYEDKRNNRRTPDLLPRDEVALAINAEVKAGRGSPHGGVYLDIASRRTAEYITRRLPSMYHQFKELADVDITQQAMEVGPTLHYIMGGVRVDAESAASTLPGLFAAGEVAAGMHGATRLGGNSLSDLLVFGRRAGLCAAEYAKSERLSEVDERHIQRAERELAAPLERDFGEDPYAIHRELQECMQELVGIIRTEDELTEALAHIARLRERADRVVVRGGRRYNPGWHLALDLRSMLAVSEAVTRSALERTESRGGHTRSDHRTADPGWGTKNVVTRLRDGRISLTAEDLPELPADLRAIVDERSVQGQPELIEGRS